MVCKSCLASWIGLALAYTPTVCFTLWTEQSGSHEDGTHLVTVNIGSLNSSIR